MKVLALNSSARTGDVSKTEIMLDCLVEGMRDAGADVEIVNLRSKRIEYCIGCFTCWTKTPGVCIHKDDMTKEIYPDLLDCDLSVLATPLYHYTVNAQLKTFIERTLPIAQPFFVKQDGVTRHPLRLDPPPVAVISVAGFPEASVFDQLRSYFNYLYGDRLIAEIYRSSAEMLRRSTPNKVWKGILAATVQGGRELVESMKISPETMAQIEEPVTDFDGMAPLGNVMWQTCIDEGVTLGEFQKKGMVPRPNSIETFLAVMQVGFNAEKARDVKATMQFAFSGEVEGECYITIENCTIATSPGKASNPDLTIKTPFELWADVLTKKTDGAQALMDGNYEIEGNGDLLLGMSTYFGQ